MKMPPLLLGAALMFWGWQAELWVFAIPMALVFEGSRLIQLRWHLSVDDFRRISSLCTMLMLILLVYLYVSDTSAYFIYVFISWLPVVIFPLLAAQAYATIDRIEVWTLFLFKRKKNTSDKLNQPLKMNLTYPYFALCIVSASAANARGVSFYAGLMVLSALAFWIVRSKRYAMWLWICCLFAAAGIGAVGHIGLHGLHLTLEEKGLEWFSNIISQDSDPFQSRTSIGDIGSLKPSNRILFRVEPDGQRPASMLLRDAVYSSYQYSMWFAPKKSFRSIRPNDNGTSWQFRTGLPDRQAIKVFSYLHKGQGVVKLPGGAFQVDHLPVVSMERSEYGTVRVEGGPGTVAYRVQFDKSSAGERPPAASDLRIPKQEKSALSQVVDDLELSGKPSREILKRIETYFKANFSYTLDLSGKPGRGSPLSHFLLQSKSGHCEYFASATTLLLRAAGIPARYAKGYSVHEFSQLENRFIVRDRHAHAWVLVYLDGKWCNFDTTPGTWTSIEEASIPGYKMVYDLWSFCWFKLSEGFARLRQAGISKHCWWLIIPVGFIIVRRIPRIKRSRRPDNGEAAEAGNTTYTAGSDSEFYLIENALNSQGFFRLFSETPQHWINRLKKDPSAVHLFDNLETILNLHYRYRFDPRGLSTKERADLTSCVHAWLETHTPSTKKRHFLR